MTLEIRATDYIQEKNKVELNLQSKLVLENWLVNQPDPSKLIDGWFAAPYNFPNTIYKHVNTYLRSTDAGKAFKGGKSFLFSRHRKNVMNHSKSLNICYCFVKCLYHPEQKLGQNKYTVWICLHKDSISCSKWWVYVCSRVFFLCSFFLFSFCVLSVKFFFSKFMIIKTLIVVTIYDKNVKHWLSVASTQTTNNCFHFCFSTIIINIIITIIPMISYKNIH